MRLKDKIAIVTGAATGIGFATAKKFLEEGAKAVVICDLSQERVDNAIKELSAFGTVDGYIVDVSDKVSVQKMVDGTLAKYGRIDVLINNAGITMDAQFYKMTEEQFDRVIQVNLKGTYICSKAVVPAMMEQQYGRIINASSTGAFNGNFGQANYSASKAAIYGMTRVMGRELGKYGITVNCVCPGFIATDMTAKMPQKTVEMAIAKIPVRRAGVPEDVANVYAFLASDEASYVSGTELYIDGGVHG